MLNLETAIKKIVKLFCFSVFFISFFGCESENQKNYQICFPQNEIKLLAKKNFTNNEVKNFRSYGFFFEKNLVLATSHSIPKNSFLPGFSEIFRDSNLDLLILKSDRCGLEKKISKQKIVITQKIFNCKTGQEIGIVENFKNFRVEDFFGNENNIYGTVISKKFSHGESGKPICNSQQEITGIIVGIDQETKMGIILPAEKIWLFLEKFQKSYSSEF